MTYPVLQAIGAPLSTIGQRDVYLFGDSFCAGADLAAGANVYTQIFGNVWTFAGIYCNTRVSRVPQTNNYGVGGNSTAQMLARIATLVAALTVRPGIVVIAAGTNDVDAVGASATASIANLRAIYAAILATGSTIIRVSIIPRAAPTGPFTSGGIKRALAMNQSDRRYAEVTPGFFFIDLDPVCTDLTASSWTLLSGIAGADGTHPSTSGCSVIGKQIAAVINSIFPSWRKPTMTNSDVFDATDNTYGNLLTNGMLTGTGGALSGGATGSVATSCTIDAASASGAAAAGSITTGADGRKNQVITLSGSKTGTGKWVDFQQLTTSLSGLVAGDILEGELELTFSSHTNIAGVDVFLQTNEGGTFYTAHASNPDTTLALPTDGYGSSAVLVRTPRRVLTTTPTSCRLFARIFLLDGSVSVAGVVTVASMSVRKVQ